MQADDGPLLSAEDLYEHAACGLLVTGGDGTIRRVNSTFCRWVGCTADDLVGQRKLQDLLTMGGRIFHQTHWAPLLQMQGSIAEVKLDLVHTQGHTIPVIMNAVSRTDGRHVRHEVAVFVAEDRHQYERELVRARKHAEDLAAKEQQAQQALLAAQAQLTRQRVQAQDRALFAEQMVGIVSHDLRNPLSAIQMSAQLMERGEMTAQQRTVLGRIGNSTARALRLITGLLDFTQARIGKGLTISRKPIRLHPLVSESVEELALAFPGRRLGHQRSGDGECSADPDRLVQLIGNLVANAMAYGAPDQPVRVMSRITPQGFEISVHNQGTPIPPDQLAQLFEPMIRGAGGKGSPGVGLGLFIVREIAHAHAGEVSVTSSPEAGTVFTARFPREENAPIRRDGS
jgi:sigma-B regulation protein RsbU (phosphoserine phosphatase)